MSHLFFSLSLSSLSLRRWRTRKGEREPSLALSREAKSAFCVVFFYYRDGAKAFRAIFFLQVLSLELFWEINIPNFGSEKTTKTTKKTKKRKGDFKRRTFRWGRRTNVWIWISFFLYSLHLALFLTIFLFSRERKKERVFFLRFKNALTQPVPSQGTPAAFV